MYSTTQEIEAILFGHWFSFDLNLVDLEGYPKACARERRILDRSTPTPLLPVEPMEQLFEKE